MPYGPRRGGHGSMRNNDRSELDACVHSRLLNLGAQIAPHELMDEGRAIDARRTPFYSLWLLIWDMIGSKDAWRTDGKHGSCRTCLRFHMHPSVRVTDEEQLSSVSHHR
jgi:hypothetical protein